MSVLYIIGLTLLCVLLYTHTINTQQIKISFNRRTYNSNYPRFKNSLQHKHIELLRKTNDNSNIHNNIHLNQLHKQHSHQQQRQLLQYDINDDAITNPAVFLPSYSNITNNNKTAVLLNNYYNSAYECFIYVGTPGQEFLVVWDTGSSDFWFVITT